MHPYNPTTQKPTPIKPLLLSCSKGGLLSTFFLNPRPQACPLSNSLTSTPRAHKSHWTGPKARCRKERRREVQPKGRTNLSNKGLTSADRSNKATLPLTVPRSIQVVCKRFTPAHIQIAIHGRAGQAFPQDRPNPSNVVHEPKLYSNTSSTRGTNIVVSGTDSGLEAFSHNPADDSFAPLPDRTGANTKYLNERFLSY